MAARFLSFLCASLFVLKDSLELCKVQKIALFSLSCPLASYRAQFDYSFRGQCKPVLNDCFWKKNIPDSKVLRPKWFWGIYQ